MNVYDRQLASDGRIFHALGLMLARDEHGTARPVSDRGDARSTLAEGQRCAWCDAATGRKPAPGKLESHGICQGHKDLLLAEVAA